MDTSLSLNVRGEEKKCPGRVEERFLQRAQCQGNVPFSFALAASVLDCSSLTGRNGFFHIWVFDWFLHSCIFFIFYFISVVGVSDFVRNSVLGSVLLDFLLSSSSIYLFYWCIIS